MNGAKVLPIQKELLEPASRREHHKSNKNRAGKKNRKELTGDTSRISILKQAGRSDSGSAEWGLFLHYYFLHRHYQVQILDC